MTNGGPARSVFGDEVDPKLYAHVKRFCECWTADDRFRAAVSADTAGELDIDPSPLSFLWEPSAPVDRTAPEYRAFQRINGRGRAYLDFVADDAGATEPYRAWRARQRARSAFAQGTFMAPFNLHLPFAVELTRGCSLGCWFCGLSASSLTGVLSTDLDAWEKMLEALGAVFGANAARGFLYWATEPLDHPDYEAYADVFRGVLGRFPNTTTAAALADLDRTRRLIALSRSAEYPYPVVRFSVVSRRQLHRIHAAFTAEELADVDFAMVNRESVLALAEAGHARKAAAGRPERTEYERRKFDRLKSADGSEDLEIWAHRTICCVSGFLIEPVIGRVRLISPEPSSDRWPDGCVVFGEERFEGAGDFAGALDRLVVRHMTPDPPERLALQRGVTVAMESPASAKASGRGHQVRFTSPRRGVGHLPALAVAFRGGARWEEVAQRIARRFGIAPRLARKDTLELWRRGVLVESFFSFADVQEPQAEAAAG